MTESLLFTPPTIPSVDPNKNYVEELVGDGKKFKSIEDLARGKYEADLHISLKNKQFDELAADYKRLREEYNAGPKLQEAIDRLLAAKETPSSEHTPAKEDTKPAFDPEQLDARMDARLAQFEADRKSHANEQIVRDKLQEKFGDKFSEMLAAQTQKLGLTADRVTDIARTSPSAFFRLMGLEEQQQTESFQSPPRSSQNTNFTPSGAKTKKWSDYKALQKTHPNLFSDPKTHNQMMSDIKAIGEKAFYDV